jgi:hypothetical protein
MPGVYPRAICWPGKKGAIATAAALITDTVNHFSNVLTNPSRKWYGQSLVVGSPSGSQTMTF